MKRKRIIAVLLAATVMLSGSLTAWATEVDEIQILTGQESEPDEIVEEEGLSNPSGGEPTELESEESVDPEIEEDTQGEEIAEVADSIEEPAEDEEVIADADMEVGLFTGMKEIAEIDSNLIGSITESDSEIQPLASYEKFSYSYTYTSLSFSSAGGVSASKILDKAVTLIVGNEGGYNTVVANDNNSGALSLGKIGWWADSALTVVRLIVAEDNATAYNLLGKDLYDEIRTTSSWSSRTLSDSEVKTMKKFLDPSNNPASKTIQDKLANSYVTEYLNNGYKLGICNAAALVYFADINNQYGYSGGSMGAAKACAQYAYNIAGDSWSSVTLNELHLAAVANVAHNYASRSNVGSYLERRRYSYGQLAICGWTYCNSGDYTIPYDSNGSTGPAWLQVALNYYRNAGLSVTGKYDDALKSAVKSYQSSAGLTADGLAGLKTTTKLIHDMYYKSMQTYGESFAPYMKKTDIVKINGTWTYTVNGVADYSYTGLAKNSNGWWYVEKGVVKFNYNGFAQNSNGKWYVEDSKVTFNKNSVIKDTAGAIGTKGTWYYVVGSKVQTSFTGLANYKNSNGWWYIKNGQVDFSHNGVDKNVNGWYYVTDGKVQFGFTGLANYKNSNGWWYIKGGKVDFSYKGLAKNKNGWYYLEGGKVIFSYNGFASNSNGKWYVDNGKVTFNKNSVLKDTTGAIGTKGTWYYVVGSKVQTGFTGLANYKNSNGWWYIKNGKVDFTANTVAKNKNGWYYVTGGKVQFGFTGLANYKNSNGWWYIKKGKVDFTYNGLAKNKNGWYYLEGGKVRFSYNGFASNSNGKWYVENGKVTFNKNGVLKDTTGAIGEKGTWYYVVGSKVQSSFTGLADYKNSNGWWYIKNGVVDFTFNGVAKNKNGWWYVKDGKVQFDYTGTVTADGVKYSVENGKVDK